MKKILISKNLLNKIQELLDMIYNERIIYNKEKGLKSGIQHKQNINNMSEEEFENLLKDISLENDCIVITAKIIEESEYTGKNELHKVIEKLELDDYEKQELKNLNK